MFCHAEAGQVAARKDMNVIDERLPRKSGAIPD
jgi:hypothetical protein